MLKVMWINSWLHLDRDVVSVKFALMPISLLGLYFASMVLLGTLR